MKIPTYALIGAMTLIISTAPVNGQFAIPIKLPKPVVRSEPAAPSNPQTKDTGLTSGLKSIGSALNGKPKDSSEEVVLGEQLAAKLIGSMKLVKQPDLQRYVNSVGKALADGGERKELSWRFGVVSSESVNAFALPGGIVLISSGLYRLLESEEVAGLGQLASSQVSKDSRIADTILSRATEVIARGLDKDAEYEADRDGIVLAARGGYDVTALLNVLEKLAALNGGATGGSLMFSTHPTPEARLEALANAATEEMDVAAEPSPAASRIQKYSLK